MNCRWRRPVGDAVGAPTGRTNGLGSGADHGPPAYLHGEPTALAIIHGPAASLQLLDGGSPAPRGGRVACELLELLFPSLHTRCCGSIELKVSAATHGEAEDDKRAGKSRHGDSETRQQRARKASSYGRSRVGFYDFGRASLRHGRSTVLYYLRADRVTTFVPRHATCITRISSVPWTQEHRNPTRPGVDAPSTHGNSFDVAAAQSRPLQ